MALWTVERSILGVAAGTRWEKVGGEGQAGSQPAVPPAVRVEHPGTVKWARCVRRRPGQENTRSLADAFILVQQAGGAGRFSRDGQGGSAWGNCGEREFLTQGV
jgi:hypothetical protein